MIVFLPKATDSLTEVPIYCNTSYYLDMLDLGSTTDKAYFRLPSTTALE